MRKLLALLAGGLMVLGGLVGLSTPAQAGPSYPMPASMGGHKFWTNSLCVANGDNAIPIGQAAQSWNIASKAADGNQAMFMTFSNNCVNAGYPASRRMTIDTDAWTSPATCTRSVNLESVVSGTWRHWTNNPVKFINRNCLNGVISSYDPVKLTTMAIGSLLAFLTPSSSGWASRVMCTCSPTVKVPSNMEGTELTYAYRNMYIGPF